jgi:flagellar hook-associated protein 2
LHDTGIDSNTNLPYEQGGADAKFTLNGLATSRHSNNFTINGTTFNIKGNTAAGESVGLTVSNDVDAVFNKIKDFITKYNDTIKTINDKISEKRNRDYPPLTDAQKSAMSDKDIELWTEKAKSGMLSSDSILPSALSEMRQDFYSPVSGADPLMNQLAEIGITTSPVYQDNGKLEIDETKLKQALSDNPDAVMELFTANGSTTATQGIAARLYTSISNTMDKISQKAGSDGAVDTTYFLGGQISDMDTKISEFEKHLNDVQKRYYAQFTAMESAIQRSNTQAGMIASQFSGG